MEFADKNAINTLYEICKSIGTIPEHFSEIYKIKPKEITSQPKCALVILLESYIKIQEKSKDLGHDAPYKIAAYTSVLEKLSELPNTLTFNMLVKNNIAGKSIMKKIKMLFPYINILIPKSIYSFSNCDFALMMNDIKVKRNISSEQTNDSCSSSNSDILTDSDDESVTSTWSTSSYMESCSSPTHRSKWLFEHKHGKKTGVNCRKHMPVILKNKNQKNETKTEFKQIISILSDIEHKLLELNPDVIHKKDLFTLSEIVTDIKVKYYKKFISVI